MPANCTYHLSLEGTVEAYYVVLYLHLAHVRWLSFVSSRPICLRHKFLQTKNAEVLSIVNGIVIHSLRYIWGFQNNQFIMIRKTIHRKELLLLEDYFQIGVISVRNCQLLFYAQKWDPIILDLRALSRLQIKRLGKGARIAQTPTSIHNYITIECGITVLQTAAQSPPELPPKQPEDLGPPISPLALHRQQTPFHEGYLAGGSPHLQTKDSRL